MNTLEHLVMKSRHATKGGFGCLSTGEKLAVALILNRPDLLDSMSYTIAEALGRIGQDWVSFIPAAAKEIVEEEALKSGKLKSTVETISRHV